MPAMDGLGLVAELRDRRISTPAMLVTAHPNENIRKKAAAAGIPIVEKPPLGSRLLDRIHEVFRRTPKIVVVKIFLACAGR